MAQTGDEPRVVPAQLDFLTIYNPTLNDSEESLRNQIVFYHSRRDSEKRKDVASKQEDTSHDGEENERLRQVGLAQGMVNFAK